MASWMYDLLGLFFVYGMLGWFLETAVAVIRKRRFVNRGFFNGPVCGLYGTSAVLMKVFLGELKGNWIFLFLGCMILSTCVEWLAGHALERIGHGKWWDYSEKKWNMDGYVCLQYSALWGILGVVAMKYTNGLFLGLLHLIPGMVLEITLLVLLGILVVDGLGSYLVLRHMTKRMPAIVAMNDQIDAFTRRIELKLYRYLERRVEKAYPNVSAQSGEKKKAEVFAEGCSFYKIVLLFIIGAFLGDLVETVFCRLTAGVWMSRSSLVWGPFSVVWGLALALGTWFLYNYRERSDGFLFLFGTFLGGAYEYLCSVATEIAFGKTFWDYSHIPFNLGGRINLLYCFFWGIAAVVWLKKLYPHLSSLIERIPKRRGAVATWLLIVFMSCNMVVSTMALIRYSAREMEIPARSSLDRVLDKQFDDARMERIYPNAKTVK